MSDRKRIYLDHAATSWPKADEVLAAMDDFARTCGAAAGRGAYQSAIDAGSVVAQTRRLIAKIIGAESDDCVSFHGSGTAALNAAIHGILRSGDHVVTTAAEHNSVLRPLYDWQSRGQITITVVPTDRGGQVDTQRVLDEVTDQTRLVAVTSASNVTGAVQPIREIGQSIADHPARFLCDAAQTFGTLPIDVADAHIDLLAAPGHKSSGGPLGTAFLYASKRVHGELRATIQGGTGSHSESLNMPTTMPDMMEAGNLNVPAIAGWLAALTPLSPAELDRRATRATEIARRLHDHLRSVPSVTLHASEARLPIASITSTAYAVSDLAAILDSEFGIETRSGLHCAALIHDCIESGPAGTLRFSGSPFTSDDEIETVAQSLEHIFRDL
ncbi:putative cysteine desulfurase [Rubripirellula tenax]|uniref:cysteine desulfurase n=1 Tax=Rubripirellula tenax TaxID=2528015 RepID=A0A5C6FFN4_9BACT|nr:aminotransferase class V-fold PLP-dependent enzyme [Rubripirellula tenax]TWU58411.1 putative cysteine desulfurase [Rubripirellula tenax]